MITATSSSPSENRSQARASSRTTAGFIEFPRCGLLIVISAIPSSDW
ncbi:Uncharacterised protein [Bordetella pertussis]|nr:Uncharacterised protein [Bordetella pertussis]